MESAIKIIVDGTPPSANRYLGSHTRHWSRYGQEKKAWAAKVTEAARGKEPREPIGRAEVRIHYVFPDRIRRDPDNYAGKMLLDPLVSCGVLRDDTFWVVTRLTITAECQKGVSRTEVTVTEAGAE